MSVQCANCGFTFEGAEEVGQPCPKCGSLNRGSHSGDEGTGHEKVEEKKRGINSKHKHKSDYELKAGEKIGKDGKLVSIKRIIDREGDLYIEIVKDKDGNLIAIKVEKLSEHREV